MRELNRYRDYMKLLPPEISEAEIEAEKEVVGAVAVSGGEVQHMAYSEVTEGFVRAGAERTGMVYTQNLDISPEEVIAQAFDNSRYAERGRKEPMLGAEEFSALPETGVDRTEGTVTEEPQTEEPQAVSPVELTAAAARFERDILRMVNRPVRASVSVEQIIRTRAVVNSKGVDVTASSDAILAGYRIIEPETGASLEAYVSVDCPGNLTAAAEQEKLERFVKTLLPAADFVPGTWHALLDPSVTTNILMHAWQLFSARAYQSGSSAYSGMLGKPIMPEFMQISDRPVTERSAFRTYIDCEGSRAAGCVLVENGVLTGLMHNLTTAEKAGIPSTGNAGRKTLLAGNIHTDMQVMPTNFVIEPGENTFGRLLELLGDGIYINESFDVHHSLDIASGKFAIPCEGILVKGGKLTGKVTGLSMNGNLKSLFAGVEAIGSELNFRPFDMYRSYVLMGPAMLIEKIEIAG